MSPNSGDVDVRFLYYALHQLQPLFSAQAQGTTTKFVTAPILSNAPLSLPSIGEQRRIATILGTLDDKIALNRRISETLESTARALFKSWFVDYDPVRAKSEGRDPGIPQPLADLFPGSFQESAVGEIPQGWVVRTLGDVAEHHRRGIGPDQIAQRTPYIGLEHMPRRSIALPDWGYADGLGSNKSEFESGDVLFGKLRPYFHKVGVAPVGGVCSTDIVVLAPRFPAWRAFVIGLVSSDAFVEHTNAGSTGTKMPRTSWNEMARYEIAMPPDPLARAFTELLQPAIDRIVAGVHESRTYADIRDALLPRLIAGEIQAVS
jgi:type I restriction enzyme S subunit